MSQMLSWRKKRTDPVQDLLVVYHGKCPDGINAAWMINLYYNHRDRNSVLFGNRNYNVIAIEMYREMTFADFIKIPSVKRTKSNRKIVFVDITMDDASMKQMAKFTTEPIDIYDHHPSCLEFANTAEFNLTFDENLAACEIVWNSLFKEAWIQRYPHLPATPWFIQAVADRDTGRFLENENSYCIASGLYASNKHNFKSLDHLLDLTMKNDVHRERMRILKKGREILNEEQKLITNALTRVKLYEFYIDESGNAVVLDCVDPTHNKRYQCAIVQDELPAIRSQLGHQMAKNFVCDFAVVLRQRRDDTVWCFSARGVNDIDLNKVAMAFNGGGHAQAAGWRCEFDSFVKYFRQVKV